MNKLKQLAQAAKELVKGTAKLAAAHVLEEDLRTLTIPRIHLESLAHELSKVDGYERYGRLLFIALNYGTPVEKIVSLFTKKPTSFPGISERILDDWALGQVPGIPVAYVHNKNGHTYWVQDVAFCTDNGPDDGCPMVVYRSAHDDKLYVRKAHIFCKKFTRVPDEEVEKLLQPTIN